MYFTNTDAIKLLNNIATDNQACQNTGQNIFSGNTTDTQFSGQVSFFRNSLNSLILLATNIQNMLPINISSISCSSSALGGGYTVTVNTSSAHNLTSGMQVMIAGVTPTDYSLPRVTVTVIDPTTISYQVKNSISTAGTALSNNSMYVFPLATPAINIASIGCSSVSSPYIVTVKTVTAHGFNDQALVMISSVTPNDYNQASTIITYVDTLTFQYTLNAAPSLNSGTGGTVIPVTTFSKSKPYIEQLKDKENKKENFNVNNAKL